ncbi:hypothetical protein MIND_00815900 [Mycena indigotica]|uniref:Rad4-domain-containing protein n=1 Tax=Mycena indigotica TaxID=2126181 RepID=A0A8H6SGX6_9AGAR|nr:uncharacterized protein MIND_00815900 [Mycena indigotica]KAF7298687.1 hypothetical protein MIND_00815900 [Mycena indigotica]
MSTSALEPTTDSEDDWEEVVVPDEDKNLEITISPVATQDKSKLRISNAERLLRINCHKLHTLTLLTNAWIRNKWINDELLQARLVSLTPMSLQTAFAMIHKSRIPDVGKRGRMFEAALRNLTEWWSTSFFEVTSDGHLRNRTFDTVRKLMGDDDEWDVDSLREILEDDGETIRGPKSLMKYTLKQRGTRDTSAQLFTALCRGLGIPARLVVSLQCVPWQTPKATYKGKGKGKAQEVSDPKGKGKARTGVHSFPGTGQRLDGSTSISAAEHAKGKAPVKLRKTKDKGNVLGNASSSTNRASSPPSYSLDPTTTPPVFWTEVFSRPDARWFPIDPIRNSVNQPKDFDPANGDAVTAKRVQTENRMVYVLAFEDDGFARDVTRRYARRFAERVVKMQGARQAAWWARVVEGITRPYRLNRDDIEDAELDTVQLLEGMPSTITGFKDHPIYVLTRHLTQTQTIHPPPPSTKELGKFRGEPVYPRSAVVSLKSAESWLRTSGRRIREGEQPLKLVKARTATLGRQREIAVLKDGLRTAGEEEQGEVMTGLYAFSQTELYVPDPVVDGVIPKNNFGNIDLYVPSMLPAGAVHIPYKGTAKIAKQLGFDYAEAVTGFEFRSRRATPIIVGIVVATDNEGTILEAYWEAEQDAAAKARAKRRDRVLKRWIRLVHGLRIRQSLQEEYKDRPRPTGDAGEACYFHWLDMEIRPGLAGGGGFLEGADAVVHAFHLPKAYLPAADESENRDQHMSNGNSDEAEEPPALDLETMDVDPAEAAAPASTGPSAPTRVPKTMAELAEETAAKLKIELERDTIGGEEFPVVDYPAIVPETTKAGRKTQPKRTPTGKSGGARARAKGQARAPARRSSTRKRQRGGGSESDEAEAEYGESDASDAASPAKRVKTVVPLPTRTLRPRRVSTKVSVNYDETGGSEEEE